MIKFALFLISSVFAADVKLSENKIIEHEKYLERMNISLTKFWIKATDLYPQENDTKKKLIQLTGDGYDSQIIERSSGKMLSARPWFIAFISSSQPECNMLEESLQHLAHYFQGDVQFAYVQAPFEENLAYTYDVYFTPRSYYIDIDGMAYGFEKVLPAINTTIKWIEDKAFKQSPLKYKAPGRWADWKLYWGYVKKEVRFWYKDNLQPKIEPYCQKLSFTYACDMEPGNWESGASVWQKTDRQILLIFGLIFCGLESLWDYVKEIIWPGATVETKKKNKVKSFMSKKKDEPSEEAEEKPQEAEQKKIKRDKIE